MGKLSKLPLPPTAPSLIHQICTALEI